jgi:hypothetical protein
MHCSTYDISKNAFSAPAFDIVSPVFGLPASVYFNLAPDKISTAFVYSAGDIGLHLFRLIL